MKKIAMICLAMGTSIGAFAQKEFGEGVYATFQTTKGDIIVKLTAEQTPMTVANFVALAEGNHPKVEAKYAGKPFYDGLKFHRVIANFMIQGGDPTGTGAGNPGYRFTDEIVPELKHDKAGVLSMANAGPKTNGSQFFITHKETPWLDGKHTVFGFVMKGQEVVDAIKQDDVMKKVIITRVGQKAEKFKAEKVFLEHFEAMDKKATEQKAKLESKREVLKEEAKRLSNISDSITKDELAKKEVVKRNYFEQMERELVARPSGLKMKVLEKGTNVKPKNGEDVWIAYSGYLSDGTLFDSNVDVVAAENKKFDSKRKINNGYEPFPFKYGRNDGLIPGFLEGIHQLNYGDKALLIIPSKIGYGDRDMKIIPPNSTLYFEIQIIKK